LLRKGLQELLVERVGELHSSVATKRPLQPLSEDLLPREEDEADQGGREAEALTLICLTGTVHQQYLFHMLGLQYELGWGDTGQVHREGGGVVINGAKPWVTESLDEGRPLSRIEE